MDYHLWETMLVVECRSEMKNKNKNKPGQPVLENGRLGRRP